MLTPNALPETLLSRFADDVAALIGGSAAGQIGIAVSGGPDSVALLLLAHAAFPGRVAAATVDHQLRRAARDEALFVAGLCAARDIKHQTLTIDAMPRGNVSAAARMARYQALGAWADANDIDWIMTGHHADDQRETMIMRLNRGAGVAGLSGVRARHGRIVRPLLHWRRTDLAAIVVAAGLTPIDDPTNHDDSYDRARLRKALRTADWIDAQAMAVSADALAEANAAIEWAVDQLDAIYVRADGPDIVLGAVPSALPDELLRRLVLRCLQRIDPQCAPRGVLLSRAVAALRNQKTATLGRVVARGGTVWRFSAAPPRRMVGLK